MTVTGSSMITVPVTTGVRSGAAGQDARRTQPERAPTPARASRAMSAPLEESSDANGDEGRGSPVEHQVSGAETPQPDRLHDGDDAAGHHAGEDRPHQEPLRVRRPKHDRGKQHRRIQRENRELKSETESEGPLDRVGTLRSEGCRRVSCTCCQLEDRRELRDCHSAGAIRRTRACSRWLPTFLLSLTATIANETPPCEPCTSSLSRSGSADSFSEPPERRASSWPGAEGCAAPGSARRPPQRTRWSPPRGGSAAI